MDLHKYFRNTFLTIILSLVNLFNLFGLSNSAGLQENQEKSAPVKIFYGLNESHSNDWAQIATNGEVGIVYFNEVNQLIYRSINQSGESNEEVITTGNHLEISVLLFDLNSSPHVFTASSSDTKQIITHYFKNENKDWLEEQTISFQNEGGKFIYELSAEIGDDGSFHLLALKTRSNPDSEDYYYAYLDAHLYYITNRDNRWVKELICNYDMIYTADEYSKALNRQDIDIDENGFAHVVFGEQIDGSSWSSPSRLQYATNKTGTWVIETAFNPNLSSRDDAGWFPSLKLDHDNNPNIACTYVKRYATGSSISAKLYYLKRSGNSQWSSEIVAESDDGYYGTDGRIFTGGLNSLLFDKENNPHVIFTDIASSHAGRNYWNLGNVRHATRSYNKWQTANIYRQPNPDSFYDAKEIYSICGLEVQDSIINVVAQELDISSVSNYSFFIKTFRYDYSHDLTDTINDVTDTDTVATFYNRINESSKNAFIMTYPNPFTDIINIKVNVTEPTIINLDIYDINGRIIKHLVNDAYIRDENIFEWNGIDNSGNRTLDGVYFCALTTDDNFFILKRLLLVE